MLLIDPSLIPYAGEAREFGERLRSLMKVSFESPNWIADQRRRIDTLPQEAPVLPVDSRVLPDGTGVRILRPERPHAGGGRRGLR